MLRRVVSLLLVPALLLYQWAGLGHVHADHLPVGHDLVPHFHLHAGEPDHHDHDGPCHHHDQDDEPDDLVLESPESAPLSDHEADAVYVSVDFLVGERCPTSADVGWVTCVAPPPVGTLDGWLGSDDYYAPWWPAPPPL